MIVEIDGKRRRFERIDMGYLIESVTGFATETHFAEGREFRGRDKSLLSGVYIVKDEEDFFDYLRSIGLPENPERYSIISPGTLEVSTLENAEGEVASTEEVDLWIEGKLVLYQVDYTIFFKEVRTKALSHSEIVSRFEIPPY